MKPKRKGNRLTDYDYSRNGAYFITICTHGRQKILWKSDVLTAVEDVGAHSVRPRLAPELSPYGKAVEDAILQISIQHPAVKLIKYAVMPNHVLLLLLIQREQGGRTLCAPTISLVIKQMKEAVTKAIGCPIWQKSFHDHVVRTEHGYAQIWQYIDTNPRNWRKDCFYEEPPHEP